MSSKAVRRVGRWRAVGEDDLARTTRLPLLLLAAQMGLRLSELISLERNATHLGHAPMSDVSAKDERNAGHR
jgi:hypothetical protein